MAENGAGTQLTLLGAEGVVDDAALRELYAYPPDPQRAWIRGNMIASADGGAADDGKSGGLGGAGDHALFAMMREAADVVLVGAGTVRTENYSGVQFNVAQRQRRQDRGQAEVPPIAMLTQSGHIDATAKVFAKTEVPPLIFTCTNAVDDTRHRLGTLADVIDASATDPGAVDNATVVSILAERKLFRVLSEGGPSLLGSLIANGLLDELCLTVAPVLLSGEAGRVAVNTSAVHTAMRRTHVLSDDAGYLYTRYVRGD